MEANNEILNEQLRKALNLSVDLYNAIVEMDDQFLYKMDKAETCHDIHNIQNRIYTIAFKNREFLD